jgi:PadR family transcriptional regulator, regulatory protein PadR
MAVRMTIPLQRVLQVLLEDPAQELYGLAIGGQAGLASGTVHPLLARLEGHGWLESRWEDIDPSAEGRPARRCYRLTALGAEDARAALARLRARGPQTTPLPALGQGA